MSKVTQICLAALLLSVAAAAAQEVPVLFPQPLSPRIANYNIDVRLDVEKKTLLAEELLFWYNKTSSSIYELQLHLYLNGFRNTESTYMQGTGNSLRSHKIENDGWGYIDVDTFLVSFESDLPRILGNARPGKALGSMRERLDITAEMSFIQPDDDNEKDQSVFRVPLPKPLPPGESVVVYMKFRAKLPEPPFARTGAMDEYFLVGQWFPKIGVHIDGEWNCHQFHSRTNFFADFGVYNVWMTVPENNVLGATGLVVEVTKNADSTATHYYHAEDVHDFAWTTSPEFVEVTGRSQDVDIRILMQPDHMTQAARQLEAAKLAVRYFQDWYGDYPFPNLTVVDPRRRAGRTGGMEYPTFITTGTRYGIPAGVRALEMVTIHEFGHNYWYHLLASNEFEESWLDEGVNTYTDTQIMPDAYGQPANLVDWLGINLGLPTLNRAHYLSLPDVDPIVRTSWGFYSGSSYSVNSYARPGLVLTTLQNYLGRDTMLTAMRTYVKRWRFKHPKARDFFAVISEVAGENLDWFYEQAFFSNAVLDYSVDRIFTREMKRPKGYDHSLTVSIEDSTLIATSSVTDHTSITSDLTRDSTTSKLPKIYYSGVNIRRLGEFKFPVEVEIVFDDGDVIHERWDGQELWKKLRYTRPAKLVSATVDPDFKIPLHVNYTNNSKTVKKQNLGVNKLSARTMFWMQFLLEQPEFMNLLQMPRAIFD